MGEKEELSFCCLVLHSEIASSSLIPCSFSIIAPDEQVVISNERDDHQNVSFLRIFFSFNLFLEKPNFHSKLGLYLLNLIYI